MTRADVVSTTITNRTASIMAAPCSPMRSCNAARYLRLSLDHNPVCFMLAPIYKGMFRSGTRISDQA